MTRRSLLLFSVLAALFVFVVNGVDAAGRAKAHGDVTSIESDGTITIDHKGYHVSSSATIQDARGYSTALRNLLVGSRVDFEYEYTRRGFEIISIKELPR